MIDTVRFKVILNQKQLKKMLSISTEIRQLNREEDKIDFAFNKIRKPLGSFNRNLNIDIDLDESCCYIEFSLPKQIKGHNIFLLNPINLQQQLEHIHKKISILVGEFPQPFWWDWYRLDLCYAWQMLDDISTQATMAMLQSLEYPRKKTYKYGTSVMFMGRTYTVKFYMKSAEYLAHDFKELKKLGFSELAYDLLPLSRGILRYEISLRRSALKQIFKVKKGEPIYLSDKLSEVEIYNVLNIYLKPLLKLRGDLSNTKQEAAQNLLKMYSPTKASRLYNFFTMYYSQDPTDKMMISEYERTTVWRNLRDLRVASVGMPTDTRGTVPLIIPSPYQVRYM